MDYNEIESGRLRQLQLVEIEIMKEIFRICKKNNINCFLIYGTLIGAIRHKGMIPWDDDIDLGMSRNDYEKFIIAAKQDLSDAYILQNYHTEPQCGLIFAKVRKKGTLMNEKYSAHIKMSQGIWVDIFILDNISDDLNKRKKEKLKIKLLKNLYIIKCGYKMPEYMSNWWLPIYLLAKLLLIFVPKQKLIDSLDHLLTLHKDEETLYVDCYGSASIKNVIPRSYIENLIDIEFEDNLYSCFKEYDSYLRGIYGDYMTPPPVEERQSSHIVKEVSF